MGVKIPIESERGKMRIPLKAVDCDMHRFERLVTASADMSAPNRIDLMEEAVGLYQGALLEDGYYAWIVDFQQQYEIEYAELLKGLIEYYGQESDVGKLKYYEEKFNTI